jgi:1-acyl-sn-glycerol-3-phosphate acyltransferase
VETWKYQPARDHGLSWRDRLRSVRREHGFAATGLRWLGWSLVRTYFSLWHRLRIEGERNIPSKPPFVMVANHASHLDAMVLASCLTWQWRDRIFPIAAGDVFFESTLISMFAANFLNALPMWRKKSAPRSLKELRARLVEEQCIYILFPEGKRSRDGTMSEFKAGIGMMVAEIEVPVVPCHLKGCLAALPAGAKFPRRVPIHLRIAQAVQFEQTLNERPGWESIAKALEERVRQLAKSGSYRQLRPKVNF